MTKLRSFKKGLTKINAGLRKSLGIEIRVIPQQKAPLSQKTKKPTWIIEFIGPSGVGKTTLRDYFLKNSFTFKKEAILTEKNVDDFNLSIPERQVKNCEMYDALFSKKLKLLAARRDNFVKKRRQTQLFYETLEKDFIIKNYINEKYVFLDQHIFKFFTEEFLSVKATGNEKRTFLEKRIIISCHASADVILSNLKKRKESGKTRPIHQGKTEKQIESDLNKHLQVQNTENQKLMKYGARIISINTGDSLAKNTQILDDFLQKNTAAKEL